MSRLAARSGSGIGPLNELIAGLPGDQKDKPAACDAKEIDRVCERVIAGNFMAIVGKLGVFEGAQLIRSGSADAILTDMQKLPAVRQARAQYQTPLQMHEAK